LHDKWFPVEYNQAISIGWVDELISEGYLPYIPPRDFVSELYLKDMDDIDFEPITDLYITGKNLQLMADQLFAYNDPDSIVLDSHVWEKRALIRTCLGNIVFYAAYHAQKSLGATLSDVIYENVRKISLRAQAGHIDKSDGARSEDEA
jgi:hypothetical protein